MNKLISIEKIVNRGSGMGYDENNKVVFVPFTVDGDVVDVKIVTSKRSFEIGKIESIKRKSEKRVVSKCSEFGICGGCSYQHIPYEYELEVKKRQSADNFNYDLGEVYHSEEYYYRNKVTFHASYRSGTLKLGFMMSGSNRQVDIKKCYLVPDFMNKLKKDIEDANFLNLEKHLLDLLEGTTFDEEYEKHCEEDIDNSKILKKKRNLFVNRVNDDNDRISVIIFINSKAINKGFINTYLKWSEISFRCR